MTYELTDFIGVFHNIVSKEYCDKVIAHYERMNSLGNTFTRQQDENVEKNKKDTYTYSLENESDPVVVGENSQIAKGFSEAVWLGHNIYQDNYGTLQSLAKYKLSETIKIQKTIPTGGYHLWHCEQASIVSGRRLMLAILYLNTVEDGGETEFLYQRKRVSAQAGTLMLCPAGFTHTHRGNPPLSGDKYIMNTWLEFIN